MRTEIELYLGLDGQCGSSVTLSRNLLVPFVPRMGDVIQLGQEEIPIEFVNLRRFLDFGNSAWVIQCGGRQRVSAPTIKELWQETKETLERLVSLGEWPCWKVTLTNPPDPETAKKFRSYNLRGSSWEERLTDSE